MDNILNWISVNICDFMIDILNGMIEWAMGGIISLFELGIDFINNPSITAATACVTAISVTLVSVMVAKQIFTVYIMETDGDPDSDPLQLLVKASQALALICCNTMIFNYLLKLSQQFTTEFLGTVGVQDFSASVSDKVAALVATTAGSAFPPTSLITASFYIVIIGLMVLLALKAGLRGCELTLMKILFPFFCVDLLSTTKERFNAFITTYMITFFGYSLQLLCIKLFMTNFASSRAQSFQDCIVACAWLYMALKTPKWLEKFCYSSGIGGGAGNGAKSAASMIMQAAVRKG